MSGSSPPQRTHRRRLPLSDLSNVSLSLPPSSFSKASPSADKKQKQKKPRACPPDTAREPLPSQSCGSLEFVRKERGSCPCEDETRDGGNASDTETVENMQVSSVQDDAIVCTPSSSSVVSASNTRDVVSGADEVVLYRRRSKPPASCPPLKRRFDFFSAQKTKKEGATVVQETGKRSRAKRRWSLPASRSKQWLPENFVASQKSYFAEVDAFQLSEEEADSQDEG